MKTRRHITRTVTYRATESMAIVENRLNTQTELKENSALYFRAVELIHR